MEEWPVTLKKIKEIVFGRLNIKLSSGQLFIVLIISTICVGSQTYKDVKIYYCSNFFGGTMLKASILSKCVYANIHLQFLHAHTLCGSMHGFNIAPLGLCP